MEERCGRRSIMKLGVGAALAPLFVDSVQGKQSKDEIENIIDEYEEKHGDLREINVMNKDELNSTNKNGRENENVTK